MGPLAAIVPIISAVASLASGVMGFMGKKDEQKAAEKAGQANQARIQAETKEEHRRAAAVAGQQKGSARARAAASGVRESGSSAAYIASLADEQQRQLSWLKRSGATRGNIAAQTGKDIGAVAGAGAVGQLTGGVRSAYSDVSGVDWGNLFG